MIVEKGSSIRHLIHLSKGRRLRDELKLCERSSLVCIISCVKSSSSEGVRVHLSTELLHGQDVPFPISFPLSFLVILIL